MGKITGFKDFKRENFKRREVTERVNDWKKYISLGQKNKQMNKLQDAWIGECLFVIWDAH